MTLNTHRRGPVRVLDAPDGHDVIIEGRLDVHTVPDIRDAIHAVINDGRASCACTSATPRSATRRGSASSSTSTAAPPAPSAGCSSSTRATARRACCAVPLERILAPRHPASAGGTVAPLTA